MRVFVRGGYGGPDSRERGFWMPAAPPPSSRDLLINFWQGMGSDWARPVHYYLAK